MTLSLLYSDHAGAFLWMTPAIFGATLVLHAALLRVAASLGLLKTSVLSAVLAGSGALAAAAGGALPCPDMALPAAIASFFAYQLFFFLGPATADRSLTAHLLMRIGRAAASDADLLQDYDPAAFLGKRFDECSRSGLVRREDGRLALAARGEILASLYEGLVRLYGLDRRAAWRYSFRTGRR